MIPVQSKTIFIGAGVAAVALIIIFAYFKGKSVGTDTERAKWVAVQAEQARAVVGRLEEIEAERQALEAANAELVAASEEQKAENRRLSENVENLIDSTSSVRVETIEVEGDCPVFTCPTPDIGLDFGLHNCAVDPRNCRANETPSEANRGDADVP